jgi:hypothetical protein
MVININSPYFWFATAVGIFTITALFVEGPILALGVLGVASIIMCFSRIDMPKDDL